MAIPQYLECPISSHRPAVFYLLFSLPETLEGLLYLLFSILRTLKCHVPSPSFPLLILFCSQFLPQLPPEERLLWGFFVRQFHLCRFHWTLCLYFTAFITGTWVILGLILTFYQTAGFVNEKVMSVFAYCNNSSILHNVLHITYIANSCWMNTEMNASYPNLFLAYSI